MVEELSLPFFRGAADVAVGDETHNLTVHFRDAQSQFAFAHQDDGLAQSHIRRQDGHVFRPHHVLCRCQQPLAEFSARMVLGKVARLEVALLNEGYCQGVAHRQLRHR